MSDGGAPHQTAAQFQIAAGKQHEHDAERHALVGQVGVEHHARQRQIDRAADRDQHEHQRMKRSTRWRIAQTSSRSSPRSARRRRCRNSRSRHTSARRSCRAGPNRRRRRAAWSGWHRARAQRPGTASRRRTNSAMLPRPWFGAPLPQPQQFERKHADAVNPQRREMAEEQQQLRSPSTGETSGQARSRTATQPASAHKATPIPKM